MAVPETEPGASGMQVLCSPAELSLGQSAEVRHTFNKNGNDAVTQEFGARVFQKMETVCAKVLGQDRARLPLAPGLCLEA